MTIDLTSLLGAAIGPLNGFVTVALVVLAAYVADCYFSRTARR